MLDLPFAAISLIWNSMMSWAGGWFFLMAAETFTAGERDFRLPGLGAYLQEAANRGDMAALELDFPPEEAARQVEVAINWGRYAELLTYHDTRASLSLDTGMPPEPPDQPSPRG